MVHQLFSAVIAASNCDFDDQKLSDQISRLAAMADPSVLCSIAGMESRGLGFDGGMDSVYPGRAATTIIMIPKERGSWLHSR